MALACKYGGKIILEEIHIVTIVCSNSFKVINVCINISLAKKKHYE